MTRRPRKGEEYELVPGWQSAYQQVKRMEERGEIQFVPCKLNGKVLTNIPNLVLLPKDRQPSYQNWEHEIARGDVYVSLHNTRKVISYRWNWHIDEYRGFAKDHGIKPDGRFELDGVPYIFFLEVDMGSEYWSNELDEKVKKYAGLADSMPQIPFYVLFSLQTKGAMDLKERGKRLMGSFEQYGRGHNFLLAPHGLFVDNPTGPIFADYRSNEAVSLLGLN